MSTRPVRPKYQVFVSSTFVDLRQEREAVTWEILKAGHIPVGMENFSADDDRGWKVINRTLETTDYYVLILAGRYGSIDDSLGMSWTEREYRRAIELGIPVLAFIREKKFIPGDQMDTDEKAKKLADLISDVSNKRLRETWTTPDDLRAKVSLALRKAIDDDETEGNPRPGWYRGNQLPSPTTMDELARLSAENRTLREELDKQRSREESALCPFITNSGNTSFTGGDNLPLADCNIENHGSVPFTIKAAQAKWWFVASSQESASEAKPAEIEVRQHGAQPGGRGAVRVIFSMALQQVAKFSQRIQADPYTSPVEAELEVTCESPGGATKVVREIVRWPVARRPRTS